MVGSGLFFVLELLWGGFFVSWIFEWFFYDYLIIFWWELWVYLVIDIVIVLFVLGSWVGL